MAVQDHTAQDAKSYYDILEVAPSAGDDEIKSAYRRLAFKYHPDQNSQEQRIAALRFKLINEAYSNLKTREARARYNASLRRMKAAPSADNDNGWPYHNFWTRVLDALFKGGQN